MKREKFEELKKEFPHLFDVDPREPIAHFGVECSEGWDRLVRDMCAELSDLDTNKSLRIEQIKEKFADLRVYVGGFDNPYLNNVDEFRQKVYKIISKYEVIASKTCEHCGSNKSVVPGTINNHWLTNVCEQCIINSKGSEQKFSKR